MQHFAVWHGNPEPFKNVPYTDVESHSKLVITLFIGDTDVMS